MSWRKSYLEFVCARTFERSQQTLSYVIVVGNGMSEFSSFIIKIILLILICIHNDTACT